HQHRTERPRRHGERRLAHQTPHSPGSRAVSLLPPVETMPPAFRTVADAIAEAPQGSFNARVAMAAWRALLVTHGDVTQARRHVNDRPDLHQRWRAAIHRLLDRADTTTEET